MDETEKIEELVREFRETLLPPGAVDLRWALRFGPEGEPFVVMWIIVEDEAFEEFQAKSGWTAVKKAALAEFLPAGLPYPAVLARRRSEQAALDREGVRG